MSAIVAAREFKPSLQRVLQIMGQDSRSQEYVWFRKWMHVLSLGLIAWVAFNFFSTGDVQVLESAIVGLVIAALGWFVFFWAMPRLSEKAPHNKSAFTPRRYKFDADTLFLETADGVSLTAPYRTFISISMGSDWILFYENFPGLAAHAIPCEVFESKDQENVVRDWLAVYAA